MKDLEGRRMNFLRQRGGAFTYRSMLLVIAGCLAFLFLAWGLLLLREMGIRGDLSVAKKAIENLNAQKDRQIELLSALGKERVGTAAKEDLTGILTRRVRWSAVLKAVTRSLKPQMWLNSVAVEREGEAEPRLRIKGKARSQRSLASFIMQLESGGMFRRTEQAAAKRTEGGEGMFDYEIFTIPAVKRFQ